MNWQLKAMIAKAFLLSALSVVLPSGSRAQEAAAKPNNVIRDQEPPGRDLYVPYVPAPGLPREKELENVEQVRILAEMNKLTVELVKRRSNRYAVRADTPQLVKRLKELAKKLHDMQ